LINVEPLTVIIHMVLFLVMVYAVLNPLLLQPLLRIMGEREIKIEGNIKDAEELSQEASELETKYSEKIEQAKKDALREKDELRKVGEEEEQKIIKDARGKAGDVVADIREKIAAQYAEAKKTLEAETEAMGKDVASKILGRQI